MFMNAPIDLGIDGMTCAACVARVEKVLGRVPGVAEAQVNLATGRARVVGDASVKLDALTEAVRRAGYTATPVTDRAAAPRSEWPPPTLVASALLTIPLLLPMLTGGRVMPPAWLQLALATPVQFFAGARFYVAGWKALRAGGGNMDLLVALGTSAAFFLSLARISAGDVDHLYFELAAVVITLVLLGRWLEARARRSTASAIRSLASLRPDRARVLRDGTETDVALALVAVGDVVVIGRENAFPSMA